jgi:hypothetical protein
MRRNVDMNPPSNRTLAMHANDQTWLSGVRWAKALEAGRHWTTLGLAPCRFVLVDVEPAREVANRRRSGVFGEATTGICGGRKVLTVSLHEDPRGGYSSLRLPLWRSVWWWG